MLRDGSTRLTSRTVAVGLGLGLGRGVAGLAAISVRIPLASNGRDSALEAARIATESCFSFISLCYITMLLVASSFPLSVKATTLPDPEESLPTLSPSSDLTSRSGGRTADLDDIEPDSEPG
jgi:hypothetical protein